MGGACHAPHVPCLSHAMRALVTSILCFPGCSCARWGRAVGRANLPTCSGSLGIGGERRMRHVRLSRVLISAGAIQGGGDDAALLGWHQRPQGAPQAFSAFFFSRSLPRYWGRCHLVPPLCFACADSRVACDLQVGEISGLVETDSGTHIILRTE